jgi:hypothetical protein
MDKAKQKDMPDAAELSSQASKVDKVEDPRDKALQPPKPVQTSTAAAESPCPSCGNVGRYRIKSAPPQERCSACFKPFSKGT